MHSGTGQVLEDGDQVEKFVVVGVGEPAADGKGVLRMKDVRRRRVIDNDGVLQVSSHLGEILDVVALVIVAALSEKPMMDNLVDVQLVQERVAVLGPISR